MSWFRSSKSSNSSISWIKPSSIEEITILIKQAQQPILFFKHSTRCSISAMALDRVEREWSEKTAHQLIPVYIDVINRRELSDFLAMQVGIEHQSPQILLVHQGKCVYQASHNQIALEQVINYLNLLS
jgi:bacillithiol system protein YtxJ